MECWKRAISKNPLTAYFVYNLGIRTEWRPFDMTNSGNIYFSMKAMNVTITTSFPHFPFHVTAFTAMPKVYLIMRRGLSFNQKIKGLDEDQNSHIFG